VLPLCFAAFLAFGGVLVLVGANQASLQRALGLDLAASGLLGSTLALGLGVGVVAAGPLFDRYPRRPLFVASTLIAAAALLGVERDMSFARWLVHVGVAGLGIGLYDTLISAVVVQRFREHAARPMVVLHAAATLGAVLAPPLVGWIASRGHFTGSFVALGWAHLGLAAWASCVALPAPDPRPTPGDASGRALSPALLPFAAIAFAYVGVEAAATVFSVPYAVGALGLDEARGQLGISAFWLGLLAGRVGVLALRRPLDARVLGVAGALGAVLFAGAPLAALPGIEGTLFAAGLALGCVYPLMIALTGQRFPHARGTAAGLAAGAGALGGFAVPWLTGALGDAVGVRAAYASLALWCGGLAVAAAAARRAAMADRAGRRVP